MRNKILKNVLNVVSLGLNIMNGIVVALGLLKIIVMQGMILKTQTLIPVKIIGLNN